jgi:hypothetical protein
MTGFTRKNPSSYPSDSSLPNELPVNSSILTKDMRKLTENRSLWLFLLLAPIHFGWCGDGDEFNYRTHPGIDRCAEFFALIGPKKFARLEGEVPITVELHDIRMGEEIRVETPDQCMTGAICTCLGIAVINVRTKTAYLMHHYGREIGTNDRAFLERTLKEAADPADLRVALVGNLLLEPRREDNYNPDFPQEIIQFYENHGVKAGNIATALGNRGAKDGDYTVRVDPESGKVFATFHKN